MNCDTILVLKVIAFALCTVRSAPMWFLPLRLAMLIGDHIKAFGVREPARWVRPDCPTPSKGARYDQREECRWYKALHFNPQIGANRTTQNIQRSAVSSPPLRTVTETIIYMVKPR